MKIRKSLNGKLHLSGGLSAANCSSGNRGMNFAGRVPASAVAMFPFDCFCKKCFGAEPLKTVDRLVNAGILDAPAKIEREPDKNVFCFLCNKSLKIGREGVKALGIHYRSGNPHCKNCMESIDRNRKAKSDRFRAIQNRHWRLVYGFDSDERAITSVIADNAAKAVEAGRVELAKNPSRQWYLKKWKETGERVRPSNYGLENDPVKIKINKGNWTGGETTLTYDPKTGAFEMSHLEGHIFWLERQDCCDEVTGAMFKIRGCQWRANDSLGQVWEGLKKCNYNAFAMGVERDAGNPFVAAAQLLCNTI